MRTLFVETANSRALMRAFEALAMRRPGEPGLQIVFGDPGRGKTFAITWAANRVGAVLIQALPLWTPTWMLSALARELGGEPASRCQKMFEFIVSELFKNPRPIILDEADRIAAREPLVETLRTIHDLTSVPIVLVGMSEFRRLVNHRPHLHRRSAMEIEFKPATLEDARLLATELCEVQIADDVIAEIHSKSGGSIGLIVNALAEAERLARKTGAMRAARAA